jgi:putative transposase
MTAILNKNGETIREKTVGNYMRERGLKAQWIKPYTITTIHADFSEEYKNILNKQFNLDTPDAVWC